MLYFFLQAKLESGSTNPSEEDQQQAAASLQGFGLDWAIRL
jgi:hypothetical protein